MGFVPPKSPIMRLKLGRVPFGKYQGQLLTEVAVTDPKYLHWLLEQDWLQKHLRVLICKALDIDETILLPQNLSAPSAIRRYSRRIANDEKSLEKE